MSPSCMATIAASLSAVAAFASAGTAVLAHRLQASIAQSRKEFVKKDILLQKVQSLVVDFAEIRATANERWSDQRSERLSLLAARLRHTAAMVESLDAKVGARLSLWKDSGDSNGNNLSQVVDYELGSVGIAQSAAYDTFLLTKANELCLLRDSIFDQIGG